MGSRSSSLSSLEQNVRSDAQQRALSTSSTETKDMTKEIESTATERTDSSNSGAKKKRKQRKGYDLVQYKCRRRKAAYDKCYNEWYNKKFLTAEDIDRDESCDELFDIWKECILRGMIKEREREGLGPPKEGSILGTYLEDQNDE